MAYIGVSPSNGVRRVHTYTATASQTTFSGAGAEGTSLSYKDSNFVDVYQNGVKLGDADYTATSGTSIVLGTGASASDLVVIVVFDVFSVADTVSKADGGTFDGAVTLAGGVAGDVVFNDDSASVDFRIESNDDANMFFLDGSANAIGIRTSTDYGGQLNVETTGQAYNVVLACTDDDANNGPLLDFYRNSSSPADSDLLGEISFRGRNDNSQDVNYGHISGKIIDASDGTEDGMLDISTIKNGTKVSRIKITDDGTVLNEDSKDIDFRVESDSHLHAIFMQASSSVTMFNTTDDDPVFNNSTGASIGSNNGSGLAGVGQFSCSGGVAVRVNRSNEEGAVIGIHSEGTQEGIIGIKDAQPFMSNNGGTNNCGIRIANNALIPCNNIGAVSDDNVDLGAGDARYDDVFATNTSISTSDKNEKQDIEELSEAEKKVAVACKSLLRKYKWKKAVTEKSDKARIHFGIIAQDLEDAFKAEGLDASKYAMFCSDTWTDIDGKEQTRLGVRYSELLAFIISAI